MHVYNAEKQWPNNPSSYLRQDLKSKSYGKSEKNIRTMHVKLAYIVVFFTTTTFV